MTIESRRAGRLALMVSPTANSQPPMILIEDLHKRFEDNDVLRGVNLAIEPGTTLVIGGSGSGKSVLMTH